MNKFRVLMTDTIFPDTTIEQEELRRIDAEFVLAPTTDPDTLKREGARCDAAINVYVQLTKEILDAWPKCRVIVRTGIGYNTIDLEAANARRIMVANVPDYCMGEVADHTVGLFLACVRHIPRLHASVKGGQWSVDLAKPAPRLQGKLYGLFGFGNIAQQVAKRVQAFGLEVIAFDPYVAAEAFAARHVRRAASSRGAAPRGRLPVRPRPADRRDAGDSESDDPRADEADGRAGQHLARPPDQRSRLC